MVVHKVKVRYALHHYCYRSTYQATQRSESLQPPFTIEVLNGSMQNDTNRHNASRVPKVDSHSNDFAISAVAASYRTRGDDIVLATPDDHGYLWSELNVDRLTDVYQWLFIAGRLMPPRPLHRQRLMLRELIITEQMDLHLVWSPNRMYLKPIPRFLLEGDFWRKYICPDKYLFGCAVGFLLSYTALIQYQSDFRIALDMHLVPEEITWSEWVMLVEQLLDFPHERYRNKRYNHGELRLGRLDMIYRFTQGRIRGYLNGYASYSHFLHDNFKSLLGLFAFLSIVLSAMQVGLGTQQLEPSYAFNTASYVFVVFAIVALLFATIAIAILGGGLFIYNFITTMKYRRQRSVELEKMQAAE